MERAERNELEDVNISDYQLFEGLKDKEPTQAAAIADYLDFIFFELAEGIRRQEKIGRRTHCNIIDVAASLHVSRVAYRSCTDKGWIDHEHGSIPLNKREGALTAAHLAKELGISEGRAEQSINRLKERGEIRAAGAWQPSPSVYYTRFKHALFDDPPAWARKIFPRGKKLFSEETGTHEQQKIIEEYKDFWNSTEEKQEPTEEKQEPTEAEKSLENTAFSSPDENENTDDYYKSISLTEVTVVFDSNKAASLSDDKAAEDTPQVSICPPCINTKDWYNVFLKLVPAAIKNCTDESTRAELDELAATMRNGSTDFAKTDACAKILLLLDGLHQLPAKYTAPRQGIGS